MVITQTPLRISFLGGGTDYPEYFRRYGGSTLVATINKYALITVHRLTAFVDYRFRIHYSQVESVSHLDEIHHPSARECLRFLGMDGGIEIHYVNDLPAGTGLGSSSAATVGLLKALHAFRGEVVSAAQVAAEAIHVEQDLIKERVGSQDQYACALGGLRLLEFHPDGQVRAEPIAIPPTRLRALEERLMLLYTHSQRNAHDILEEQVRRTAGGDNTSLLGELRNLARRGVEVLAGTGDLVEFGQLLDSGWQLKRGLSSQIASPWIDELYVRARRTGAVGGKLLGAGGGGFLLLYVEPGDRARVRASLAGLADTTFAFEDTGSTIIFYRP